MSKVIVVGGGAAGMFAAYFAAQNGHTVTLLEKNEKLGKKIYITGKGRCNITNSSDMEVLFQNVMSNRKFLYSAFYSFDNQQVMSFFENHGLEIKVERGNRVFPVSDHSSDVIQTLAKALKQVGVRVMLHTEVSRLLVEEDKIAGVILKDRTKMEADAVVLATGGMSYPSTGSTGDGYRFASETGHKLVSCTPSLVPFECKETWVKELQGLSLKNTAITIFNGKKKLYEDFGEMLFTHFGVSGPMILSASGSIPAKQLQNELQLIMDLKPALTEEQLDKRVLRDFEENINKVFKNVVGKLLPSKLVPIIIELCGIPEEKKINEISREERQHFVHLVKHLSCTITGVRGWNEAIITKGGVSVKEINPSTMESKKIKGFFMCGELLDLDALTGGYNLQIAWSTGYLAGISIE